MDKIKPGHFYILGVRDKRFWAAPLHYVMKSNIQFVALIFDEESNSWKETIWEKDQFDFVVEVEKIENTIPFSSMKDNFKQKIFKAVLER